MAQLFLNIIEDLPVGNTGMDQQLLSIDSWASIDGYVESPSDALFAGKLIHIFESMLFNAALIDDLGLIDGLSAIDTLAKDTLANNTIKSEEVTISTSDQFIRNLTKTINEAMYYNGTFIDDLGFFDELTSLDAHVVQDNLVNNTIKSEEVAISTSDQYIRNLSRTISEPMYFNGTLIDDLGFFDDLISLDAHVVQDNLVKNTIKSEEESPISISDQYIRGLTKTINEPMYFNGTFIDDLGFFDDLISLDTHVVQDNLVKDTLKSEEVTINALDQFIRNMTRTFTESIYLNGTTIDELLYIDDLGLIDVNLEQNNLINDTVRVEELSLSVSSLEDKATAKDIIESTLQISDSFSKGLTLALYETLEFINLTFDEITSLVDTWADWDTVTSENAGEVLNFIVDKVLSEPLNIQDLKANSINKGLSDVLKVLDRVSKDTTMAREIVLALAEYSDRLENDQIAFVESMAFAVALQMKLDKIITEPVINISDTFSRGMFREFFESLLVAEIASTRSLLKAIAEDDFSIMDTFSKPLAGYVSHMTVLNSGAGEDDFRDMVLFGSPSGFKPYLQYLQGDYEFQDARIKALVRAEADDDSGVELTDITVEVDIPDTHERSPVHGSGSPPVDNTVSVAESSGAGKRFNFTKRFYEAPEIVITVANSDVLKIPIIKSKDNTGFTVRVFDANGNPILAEISWIAQGY